MTGQTEVLRDLLRVKVVFQLRSLSIAMGLPPQQVDADLCPGDGRACYVGGSEPHYRCGTVQCGREVTP